MKTRLWQKASAARTSGKRKMQWRMSNGVFTVSLDFGRALISRNRLAPLNALGQNMRKTKKKQQTKEPPKQQPGPKPDLLIIEGDWKEARPSQGRAFAIRVVR
jgi:hypothetical protein